VSAGKPAVERSSHGKENSQTSMNANLIQPNQPIVERYLPEEGEVSVVFQAKQQTMRVSLREEHGLLRVDDALVVSPENEVVVRLKQTMRMDLAASRTKNMIKTVSGEIRTLPEEATKRSAASAA